MGLGISAAGHALRLNMIVVLMTGVSDEDQGRSPYIVCVWVA